MFSAILAAAVAAALVSGAPALAQSGNRTITVHGEGEAVTVPDVAVLSASVVAEAESAGEAMQQVGSRLRAIVETLRKFPVAEKDIHSSSVQLSPIYPRKPREETGPQEPAGFRAEHQLTIRQREIERTGGLIDALVAGGIDRIGSLHFEIAEPQALLDKARRAAMADARRRAELYAGEAAVTLGGVLAIREGGGSAPARPMVRTMEAASATPVLPGEQSVQASVTVTYGIGPADGD